MNIDLGEWVVLRNRPVGHDKPGKVVALSWKDGQLHVGVQTRPDKIAFRPADSYWVVPAPPIAQIKPGDPVLVRNGRVAGVVAAIAHTGHVWVKLGGFDNPVCFHASSLEPAE